MKYTILINQKAIFDGGFVGKTDLIDWAILDYISGWELNKKAVRQLDYVWVNYSHLLSEMPAIGINSKQVLSRRVSKIRALGLIETIQDPDGRLYAKTSALFNGLVAINYESTPVNETNPPLTLESTPCELSTQHPCELSTQHPVNLKVDIQQTTNNKPSLSKQSEDLDQEKEHCAKNAQSTDAIAPAPTPKQPKQKTIKPEKQKPYYETVEIPEFIDREMWLGWQRERKDKFKSKAAYTEFAINQHLSQLTDLHNEGFNANAALVLIRGSVWQGVNKNVCMEKLQKQKSPAIATYDEQGLQVISINSGQNYDTSRRNQQPASATRQIDAGISYLQHRYNTTGQPPIITDEF